jgi:chromosome partitioning protein
MKVITFMNSKGGVGKTTLCSTLARSIQLDNPDERQLLVDADKSLKVWHNAGDGFGIDLVGATTRASMLSAKKMANELGAEIMLIDTGGLLTEVVGTAASISDMIIIPVRASALDVWATLKSITVIDAALSAKPNIKPMFVMNSVEAKTSIVKDVIEALNEKVPYIPVAKTIIHERVVFAKMVNQGKTIYEAKGKEKCLKAIAEFDKLTSEILTELYIGEK